MQNNKLSSNDFLPTKFYKTFNQIFETDLRKLYIEICQLGEMSRSMRQASVSCLCKKGDRKDITNWHSISLLSNGNEIYIKILANKIQLTLEDIIGPD